MYLVKDSRSPFYKLIYFDENGKRCKISTKETIKRKAIVFMHNFKPSDLCIKGVGQNEAIIPIDESIKRIKLSNFEKEYLDYVEQIRSKSYIASIKFSFRIFRKEAGNIDLIKIDKRIVEKFINDVFVRTERTAALFYRTLKAAFAKAEDWEYIKDNPFKKVKLPKLIQALPCFLSLEELKIIVAHEPNLNYRQIYLAAYYTGLRRGELLNLKWGDVDVDGNIITIRNSESFNTKSKKDRIVPICQPLKELLLQVKRGTDQKYVFETSVGKKYCEPEIGKKFKKALRAAGVDDRIHFHTLRHSFASTLVQNGVSLYVVKELLGHSDIKTTMIYSHLRKDELIKGISSFNVA